MATDALTPSGVVDGPGGPGGTADPGPETAEAGDDAPLRGRIGRGAAWAAASNILMRLANIAVTAALARILAPEDFGVFAIALAVYLIVSSLGEAGLGSAIARSREEPSDIAPTVTTIAIATSTVLAVVMLLGADAIATTVGQPGAAAPLRVLSLSMVLTGLFAVPGAQLVREFRQDRIFLATLVGFVVSNPLLVVLALNGGDATSFAWSRVVGQLATGLVFLACTRTRYRPGWRPGQVRGLLAFGLPLSLANLVNWSLLNADYLIIGRMVDATQVGVYMIAFNVASWATAVMGSVLNNVVLPAYGRIADDPARVREALVASTRLVALVAVPIGAVSAALAPSLVHTLFGPTWAASADVLTVLAVYGAAYSFTLLHVNVLIATGGTRLLLLVQVAWVAALVPATVWGVLAGGVVGAAWAHVVVVLLVAVPGYLGALRRRVGSLPGGLVPAVLGPGAAALLAAGTAWTVQLVLGVSAAAFVVGGVAAVLVYALAAGGMVVREVPELSRLVPSRWRRTATPPASPQRPLRVGFVLEGLAFGGCPLYALDLARELRARGHHVRLVAIDEEVKVSVLPHLEAAGFEVELLPRRAGLLTRARQFRRVVTEHDLDVLHVFAPWLGRAAVLATGPGRRRLPVVLNWNMVNEFPTTGRTPLVVGTTEMYEEALEHLGGNVWLIEPPVDLSVQRPDPAAGREFRRAHGIGEDELLLTLVGRVDRVMKLPGILRAVAAVGRLDLPGLRLALVGDGNAMDEVRARAREVNDVLGREAVVLTGALADPHPAYAAADIGLAMGGSAMRSLAHEVPTIVLGEGHFSKVFEPGSAEYFVAAGFYGHADPAVEPDPLPEQVARLADPGTRAELGPFGRPFVAQRYGLEVATDTLEGLYATGLHGPGGRTRRLLDWPYLLLRDASGVLRRHLPGRGPGAASTGTAGSALPAGEGAR